MKKTCLLFAFAVVAIVSCTKNNNTTNTTVIAPLPAFTINGIHDIALTNGSAYAEVSLPITVQYADSAQETVSLSLSALPAGITMDTTWNTTGIPTFTTSLLFLDTLSDVVATPGTYPITLTAKGSVSGTKTFTFNLKVIGEPSCTATIVGKYNFCYSSCAGPMYADSVSADPSVINRIWFYNIYNTGMKIYGKYNCSTQQITIPSQTTGTGTYSGTGSIYYTGTTHVINLNLTNATNHTTCSVNMQ